MHVIEKNSFNKIDDFIENMKSCNFKINELLTLLEDLGNLILVGGSIRDIILSNNIPRDIDIIIDTESEIDSILSSYDNHTKNRFGGYKLSINDIEFDIWKLSDHWAFKEKILESDISNLKNSTFLNFDSLFYDITYRDFKDVEIFNNCITTSILDITLDDKFINLNPSKDINVLRMLVIIDKWNLELSLKSKNYILSWLSENENSVLQNLISAQLKHYKYPVLDTVTMAKLLNRICIYD